MNPIRNFILVLLLCYYIPCISQDKALSLKKNEINVELLGSNVLYSVNYERHLATKNKIEYKISTGLHFNPFRIESLLIEYRSVGINFEPKLIYNLNRNSVVLGVGYTYTFLYDNLQKEVFGCCADLSLLIPKLGYRRYTKSKSKYWGISFNPLIVLDLNEEGDEWDNNFIIPYGGIQYGWKF